MNHSYEKLSSNKAKITFTIPAQAFDEAMQKAYLKMRGQVNVPGFRKGKAPRKLIENMYGEGVFYDDAFDVVFPDAYDAAVKEYDLQPVDRPEVNVDEIGAGQDLKFTCEVFVRPDVTLGDYKGLTVSYAPQTVADEQVDEKINQDQERTSRTVDVEDRVIAQGDIVNLDYAGSVDGVPFDGGTALAQTLTIGSNMFIPGFEEQMVGLAIDEEKDLPVTFPEEYHSEELSGKEAIFHVKVNGIQVKELPALDDEFAMDVSEFDTFEAYKADIVAKLSETAQKNNEIAIENALVEKAIANATVEVPGAMIEDQIDYILREMQMRMAYQGLKMEDYLKYTGQTMEQMRAMYKGEAETRVKTELVLDAIRKAENLVPTEDEVQAQVVEQATRSGQEVEKFQENLTDQQKGYLADSAAIQKVIDLMKADATIEEKAQEQNDDQEEK